MEIGMDHVRSLTIRSGVPFDFRTCSLLRVLDMEGCNQIDDGVIGAICSLVLLKYLSLRCTDVCRIPSAIRNLENLETLDLRETQVEQLPLEVLMLPRLAHLFGRFELPREPRDEKKRRKLQTIVSEKSRLQAISGFVMVGNTSNGLEHTVLLHMRHLRKVKICCKPGLSSDSGRLLWSSLQKRFTGNNALESLSMDFGESDMGMYFANNTTENVQSWMLSSIKLHGKLSSRSLVDLVGSHAIINLSVLQLSSTGLKFEELSILQFLQRLLYLKLSEDGDGFQGHSFVVVNGGFPSLQRLCFRAPKLPLVLFAAGAMRSLTSLHLLCPSPYIWDIEHLENINEVVLHASVSDKELEAWKERARKHRNWPKISKQPSP